MCKKISIWQQIVCTGKKAQKQKKAHMESSASAEFCTSVASLLGALDQKTGEK